MLVLRSILFSFAILWRLALVMPLIIVVLAVLSIIGLVYFFIFALVFPQIAALLLLVVAFASSSAVPTMVGARLGLQAKGVIATNSYGSMFLPALGYGLLEGLVGLIIFLGGFGLFLVLSPMTLSDIGVLVESVSEAALIEAFTQNAQIAILVGGLIACAFVALRAALLVPLAAASINRDANGSRHTPFMGFGAGFVPLFILVLLAYALSYFIGPIMAMVGEWLGAGASLIGGKKFGAEESFLTWQFVAVCVVGIFIWLWVFSLQCAGATLVYLRRQERYDTANAEVAETQKMEAEDVRNLWKSRMPDGRR